MYIHSIQSLVFNRFVSYRMQFGLQLREGDFICLEEENELSDSVFSTLDIYRVV